MAEPLVWDQAGAGSSPAALIVTEAEVAEAAGRGPAGSGFESRPSPSFNTRSET